MHTAKEIIERGVALHTQGNLPEAEEAYKSALAIDEKNAVAHNNLGFVCGQQGRFEEAAEHLRTALTLNPDMAMGHANLGQVLLHTGDTADSLRHLEKAVALDADAPLSWDNLARARMTVGDYQGAEYAWMRAVKLTPSDAALRVRLGTSIAAQRRLDEAIGIYQEALSLAPESDEAWTQLGIALFLKEDFGSAESTLARAVAVNKHNGNAVRHLGLVHLARGRTLPAIAAFERALTLMPRDDDTRLDLAVLLLSQGEHRGALMHIDALPDALKETDRVRFYHGLALIRGGNPGEGNTLLTTVAEQNGAFAERAREVLKQDAVH